MNFIFKLFLTFNALSFFIIICAFQNEIFFFKEDFLIYLIIGLYITIPFILTGISLYIAKYLSKRSINKVIMVETANNDFIANYLSYFFVALSIDRIDVFYIAFGLTFLFTFYSRVSYFNPILLVFGYNFYYITTNENVKIMLISKKKLKQPNNIENVSVKMINDYTYIDIER